MNFLKRLFSGWGKKSTSNDSMPEGVNGNKITDSGELNLSNNLTQLYSNAGLTAACPNCGKQANIIGSIFFNLECEFCGLYGELKEEDGEFKFYPSKNPNPQNLYFGQLRKSLSEYDIVSEDDNEITRLELNNRFIECDKSELYLYATGGWISLEPYLRVAILARKLKNYDLEIEACQRALELNKDHQEFKKITNCYGVLIGSGEEWKWEKRILKATELKNKLITKNDKQKQGDVDKTNANNNKFLEEQCKNNNIKLEYLEIQWNNTEKKYILSDTVKIKRPEDAVMWHLRHQGYKGTTYELHPIMQLMQAGCLNYIAEKSKALFEENYRARTFNVQINMYGLNKVDVIQDVKFSIKQELLQNWQDIYTDASLKKWFSGLTLEDIEAVLDGLGWDRFHQLLEMVLENPQDNSIGWPDIFAFDGKEMLLVEVKTKDHLLDSQIYIWTNLMPKLGIAAKVVCVRKKVI